jgi:membrane protein implicated in regulation of membrane protease activity
MQLNWLKPFTFIDRLTQPLPTIDSKSRDDLWEGDEDAAVVADVIPAGQAGCVHHAGSFWQARCQQVVTLMPGTIVRVVGRRNLTLLIDASLIDASLIDVS